MRHAAEEGGCGTDTLGPSGGSRFASRPAEPAGRAQGGLPGRTGLPSAPTVTAPCIAPHGGTTQPRHRIRKLQGQN